MLNISLSFQVLPEGLQRRSFEFAQIDIVFLSCHLQLGWTGYVRIFKQFHRGSQNLFLFGLKWSPGTYFHYSKSKEPPVLEV